MANQKLLALSALCALFVACGADKVTAPEPLDSSSSSETGLSSATGNSSSATSSANSSAEAPSSSSTPVGTSSSAGQAGTSDPEFDWSTFCWPGTDCASSSSATPVDPGVSSSAARTDGEVIGSELLDHRDNSIYPVATLGGNLWMTANSHFVTTSGSTCYAGLDATETSANCDAYGRLYTYAVAQQACPTGWHIPTRADVAAASADMTLQYGGRMKDDTYLYADQMGFLWTSTTTASTGDISNCTTAGTCMLIYVEKAPSYEPDNTKLFQTDSKTKGFSVRCVQNPS